MPNLRWQWQAPDGPAPDSYSLYTGAGPGQEALRQAGITATQFLDDQGTVGGHFGYVVAVYAGAPGAPSNEATITVQPLGAPLGLAGAASYGPPAVVWSWQPPPSGPPPDSYRLYVGRYPGSETLRQAGIAALTFTDTAAVIGRPSSGYVSAVKGGQEGPPSLRAIVTILDPPLPCPNCPPVF